MLDIKQYYRLAEKFATDNSPALLTGVGVVGTLSTAILSAKAALKARDILEREDPLYDPHSPADAFDLKQKVKATWKVYIPPVSVAAVTCTATIYANRIGTRRAAALAVAYATSDKAFNEYKDKVEEMMGEKKAGEVREAVAQDQVRKNPLSDEALASAPEGTDWFYDAMHGRYFQASIEDVKAAQNHCNYILNQDGDVSLNTFYSWLGVDTVPAGEELGWRRDKGLIEVTFTSCLMSNQRPATVLNFRLQPIRHSSH